VMDSPLRGGHSYAKKNGSASARTGAPSVLSSKNSEIRLQTRAMSNINLAGLTILVVEDDSVLRKRIAARLEALGAEVVVVEAVADARSLVSQRSFDFAFLDVNLPDGRGTDLLAEKVFPPATGVIVVTAH